MQQPHSSVIRKLISDIVDSKIGTEETRETLAFMFESRLLSLIQEKTLPSIAPFYRKLLKSASYEIRERASFAFTRSDIQPAHFKVLDALGIMNDIAQQKQNVGAHSHLIDFISKCVDANESVSRCTELLQAMSDDEDYLFSDHLVIQKIAAIVQKLLAVRSKLSPKDLERIEVVTERGLKKGWTEFYAIFDTHYATAITVSDESSRP
jgi:hypothetical protein